MIVLSAPHVAVMSDDTTETKDAAAETAAAIEIEAEIGVVTVIEDVAGIGTVIAVGIEVASVRGVVGAASDGQVLGVMRETGIVHDGAEKEAPGGLQLNAPRSTSVFPQVAAPMLLL